MLRKTFILCCAIFFTQCISAQDTLADSVQNAFFLNECSISVNRSEAAPGQENRYGFGVSGSHVFRKSKRLQFTLGMEYNRVNKYVGNDGNTHFSSDVNVSYRYNRFSLPFTSRINFGRKIKVFIETGGFVDLALNCRRMGTIMHYQPVVSEEQFNEATTSNNVFGLQCGLGIRIPVSKTEIIIKQDLKCPVVPLLYNSGCPPYLRLSVGFGFRIN